MRLDPEEITCNVEVGSHFAVSQGKPDESQTHTEGSWHVDQIISFTLKHKAVPVNTTTKQKKPYVPETH